MVDRGSQRQRSLFQKGWLPNSKTAQEMKISQEELADQVGVTPEYIGKLERGERKPSLPLLIEISGALHRSLDYFAMDLPHVNPEYELDAELADIVKDCNSLQMHLIIEIA
ncbi:MAG: helix-turn-helix domain-containing protein [Pyramidobacter sp.]